jgi:5-hydroxyisourate hydrolase-like protein (transthyretin family)
VYEVFELPPGKYSVEPEVPLNMTVRFASHQGEVDYSDRRKPRVILKEKSCAGVSIYFTENTFISGKVFSPDGHPLHNVCLRLRRKDKPQDREFLMDCTEADGSFKIDQIPLGDYLLIANEEGKVSSFQPFGTLYYPGVFEKEKATVLTVVSGDQRQNVDIHIPSVRPTRIIEGMLVYSDGRPAADESVEFTADAEQGREEVNTKTDSKGRFSLPVLEGLKGSLRGYRYTFRGQYKNCPKLDQLTKGGLRTMTEVDTNVIKLEVNTDYKDLELKFPFPYCEKPKP